MNDENERPRLFVAIDLPAGVREALGRLQDDLRRRGLSGLRWTRPEGIHLTLKFLGETPAARVPEIESALAAAVPARAAFRLALGAPGTFGGRRGPRVVWLDLDGETEALAALQAAVEAALVGAGFPPEERSFSPHLTLARVPQPAPPGAAERVSRALEGLSPPQAAFEVAEVVLMRSRLQRGGAVYTRVAGFPLG